MRTEWTATWFQMLVMVTLQQVYSLIVAAKPLVIPHRPCCPCCGGPLNLAAFVSPTEHWLPAMDSS